MAKEIKVSFLVTYYNQKDCVKRSLDGIAMQDLDGPFEILAGDDGSSDGTCEVIREYMKQHPELPISLLEMPREPGVNTPSISRAGANRLNLLRHAKGKYLLWLDGDDCYCDACFVREAADRMDADESIAACMHDYEKVFAGGRLEAGSLQTQGIAPGAFDPHFYLAHDCYSPVGTCVFRNVFDNAKIRAVEKHRTFDDSNITIYLMRSGPFFYIPRKVYRYFQSAESLWNRCNPLEQALLKAENCTVAAIAPEFKNDLLFLQRNNIRTIWKNRRCLADRADVEKLHAALGADPKIRFNDQTEELRRDFAFRILSWAQSSFREKTATAFLYFRIRCRIFFTRRLPRILEDLKYRICEKLRRLCRRRSNLEGEEK